MFDHHHTTTDSPISAADITAQAGTGTVRMSTGQRIDSRRLLSGGNELVIEHAGQEYRLRLTRNDKLILTK
ncbi:hemin uptake protein HemP [Dokdonella soli]|uniref:Hemin uptake protein HemP n=1 Tax=Dokdonella soli TaxID=529810 RepID=A0ABP3TLI4_9GAMM